MVEATYFNLIHSQQLVLLRLKRLDKRRYETVITRADGVVFHVRGIGHMGTIPHDLGHFAIEQALQIRNGFWGSVAAGGVFDSMTLVSGRRKPHAAERSREILKANRGEMIETEILVGLFNQALEEGLGTGSPELWDRLERYTWTAPGRTPRKFSESEIIAVLDAWNSIAGLWLGLPLGGTLELEWPEGGRDRRASNRG